MTEPAPVTPAEVTFDGHRPVSRQFADVYFDTDGPAEVARVFVAPAAIAERASRREQTFTVAELGFGAGLNFIVTAALTRSRLHFISFERYPLTRGDLEHVLATWRRDYVLADALIAAYPPLVPGWHRRFFKCGRVQLSVYFGDVREGMADLVRQQRRGVDAWFLDGFAPARNPDMWRDELIAGIAALSASSATVTTFSAAGDVRRRLAAHGFAVRRVDQRPYKRHSTAAVFTGTGCVFESPRLATIFGAGLAGAATARALADKGVAVRLIDRGEGIAKGASRIPAAVLHPRLLATSSAEARYRLQAFLHASAWLRCRPGVAATGVLQLAGPNTAQERLRQVAAAGPDNVTKYVDARTAAELAGLPIREPGLFFPAAATVDGRKLAVDLANDASITVMSAPPHMPEEPTVYATGADTAAFPVLEVAALFGQLDRFHCDRPPRLSIVGDGVFTPAPASVWTGATYERRPWAPERASAANASRYERFFKTAPGLNLERFRGARAVTSDRLPVIGQDNGVWFNLGHGSHGTTTAVFGAEIIASRLCGEVAPATVDILALLEPCRFRERQLRRPNPFVR